MVALSATLLVAGATCLGVGPVSVTPASVVGIVLDHALGIRTGARWTDIQDSIVWNTRVPRVAMAVVAGAGLAAAGAVLQALVRNGLADPYVLGINSGASTGVAFAVLVVGGGSALTLSAFALLGGIVAIALVLALGGAAGQRGPFRLILAGLAVGYALNACTNFLVFWSDSPEAARSVLFWLLGSLAAVQPTVLAVAAVTTLVGLAGLLVLGPVIDALSSGDDSARAAGISPEHARFAIMVATSAMVGVIVAAVGGVGFVGLVVPHLARRLVGGRHRAVIPVSALLGALLLLAADTIARTVLAPQEIPVGVVTGLVGAPVLLLLLRRSVSSPTTTS